MRTLEANEMSMVAGGFGQYTVTSTLIGAIVGEIYREMFYAGAAGGIVFFSGAVAACFLTGLLADMIVEGKI